jgi:hypothetical protein
MHVRDERSHLFFQVLELFVVRSFAHGIVIISCPLIFLLIIIFIIRVVVVVGFFGGIFIVRPSIQAPGEPVILNLTSLSGFHVPCVNVNVRLCLCVRLPNLRLRLILGPGGLGLGLGVQLDLTLIVRLDELSDLMFEGGDLR